MEEQGLWRLFFATGLPEVYLAISACRESERRERERPAKTAFQPRVKEI